MLHYKPFPTFILRTPCYPLDKLNRFDKEHYVEDLFFADALFQASPELYELAFEKKELSDKLILSLYKYYKRLCTRATPFGLFAGCSVGELGTETSLELVRRTDYKRVTRPDMHYVCTLVECLCKDPDLRKDSVFYPNDSIYAVGGKIRYYTYEYENGIRVYHLSAVEMNPYIRMVLKTCQEGASFRTLYDRLSEEGFSEEEITRFLYELIDNQLLINAIEPSATDPDFLKTLIKNVGRINGLVEINQLLMKLEGVIKKINHSFYHEDPSLYKAAYEVAEKLPVPYQKKFFFQTDTFIPLKRNVFKSSILSNLITVFNFFWNVEEPAVHYRIEHFKKRFSARYETQEVPLLKVLDPEVGIGYDLVPQIIGENTLIDDLSFKEEENSIPSLTAYERELLKKIIGAVSEGEEIVEVQEKDFIPVLKRDKKLPDIVTLQGSLYYDEAGKEQIIMHSPFCVNGENMVGRFCSLDPAIEKHLKEIIRKDEVDKGEVIYAEIVHLPDLRVGNVTLRPVTRACEIPVVTQSSLPKKDQILLSDLYVSIRNGEIRLRSKRRNKYVIPRMANAHVYDNGTIPAYRFLGDMQYQGETAWGVNFIAFLKYTSYTPRVVYKNCILSLARWNVTYQEIKDLLRQDPEVKLEEWRKRRKIPLQVLVIGKGTRYYVDFSQPLDVKDFVTDLKKVESNILEEFIITSENSVVKGEDGGYNNEVLISFYKDKEDL